MLRFPEEKISQNVVKKVYYKLIRLKCVIYEMVKHGLCYVSTPEVDEKKANVGVIYSRYLLRIAAQPLPHAEIKKGISRGNSVEEVLLVNR